MNSMMETTHVQAEAAGIEALVKSTELPETPVNTPAPTQVEIKAKTPEPEETPLATEATTPTSAKRRRTELTLGDKVRLIEEKCISGKTHRYLANEFNVGKTTVHDILKKKDRILAAYKNGADSRSRKRIRVQLCKDEINKLTWHWYEHKKSQGIPIQGPVLQAKARELAEEFDAKDFRASNGWLERFKKRYNIYFGVAETFAAKDDKPWKETVQAVTDGYRPEDVYTIQEIGLLFRAPPDKAVFNYCTGSSMEEINSSAYERLTVLLCCSMTGEFEMPIVVGKMTRDTNPSLQQVPVTWRSNRRSWMTSMIFDKWIRDLDYKLKGQDRHIVLFLDISTSHPPHTQLHNIKLVFFPREKSQEFHPLNLGITDAIRFSYRKKLLLYAINQLEKSQAPKDACVTQKIFQEIKEEQACKWIAGTVKEIPTCTLAKSFESAGFQHVSSSDSLSSYSMAFTALNGDEATPNSSGELYTVYLQDNVPNNVADVSKAVNETEIQLLLNTILSKVEVNQPMTAKEFVFFDSCLQTSDTLSDGWEERLIEDFGDNHDDATPAVIEPVASTSHAPNVVASPPPPVPSEKLVSNYIEAVQLNKHLIAFAQDKNDKDLLELLQTVESQLCSKKLVSNYQEAIILNKHLMAFAKDYKNKELVTILQTVDKKLHAAFERHPK